MSRITQNVQIANLKIITILFQIILLFFTNTHSVIAKNAEDTKETQNHPDAYYFRQFQDVFYRVKQDYLHDPDLQEMTDEAISGMLKSLDPYSTYHTDDDLEFFLKQTEGEFGGIGVEIMYDSGAAKIITPIDDLPAYKAGIKAGDLIIGVNGKLVSNMGFEKAVKEMRGKPGTKLNLLVVKESDHSTKELELTREIVKIKPIKYKIEESNVGDIAYIRIVTFNNKTISELKSAMEDIIKTLKQKDKKLKGIILDVRNNPGGLLDQAIATSEYFIDHGVIVSVKTRDDKEKITSAGRFTSKAPNVPIVVLINSGSASASEILAGALQDHKRAVIVGTTSFGKGLVQSFMKINHRAGVKITTAKYLTPNGRCINEKGIEPDVFIENAKVEYPENENAKSSFSSPTIKSYLSKHNKDEKDSENFEKEEERKKKLRISDKYKEDYQYARAYDLIRGLIVGEKIGDE